MGNTICSWCMGKPSQIKPGGPQMTFNLPPLPFAEDALEPYISAQTIKFHYEKHHGGYVKKLNELVKGSPFELLDLEAVIMKSSGKIHNNACQVWNHTFFWKCLTAKSHKAA